MSKKELILNALRSGEYKQGTGALRDHPEEGCYCVLGVIVDLYIQEHASESWRDFYGEAVLPDRVSSWAFGDIRICNNPIIQGEPLAALNDDEVCFFEIADMLEESWGAITGEP
jgi:hypothetical protein